MVNEDTNRDIESQLITNHKCRGYMQNIGLCICSIIVIIGLAIGLYSFVMLKNPRLLFNL